MQKGSDISSNSEQTMNENKRSETAHTNTNKNNNEDLPEMPADDDSEITAEIETETDIQALLESLDTTESRESYLREQNIPCFTSVLFVAYILSAQFFFVFLFLIFCEIAQKKTHAILRKNKIQNHTQKNGYWSYEVCLFEKITQFHGKQRSPNFNLGKFETVTDVESLKNNHEFSDIMKVYNPKAFDESQTFLIFYFKGGTGHRQTLISLFCSEQIQHVANKLGIFRLCVLSLFFCCVFCFVLL